MLLWKRTDELESKFLNYFPLQRIHRNSSNPEAYLIMPILLFLRSCIVLYCIEVQEIIQSLYFSIYIFPTFAIILCITNNLNIYFIKKFLWSALLGSQQYWEKIRDFLHTLSPLILHIHSLFHYQYRQQ